MASDDDTNALLKEIRDLLATREKQYSDHLAEVRNMYEYQLARFREERAKSIRAISIILAVLGGIVFIVFMWPSAN
jgi:hypothetical protein